ncbi:MAG: hypothetical protein IJH64_12490 [Oscillospiraceae bacterium]|nr:hypothetical protein [Mogibacterium sp.]MBR0343038.1 hypothetical protein [Oscillospiraceae bacterium]
MTDNKIIGAFKRLLTMTLALVMVLGSAMPLVTQEVSAFNGKVGSKYTVHWYKELHYGPGEGGYSNAAKCDLGDDLGSRFSICVQPNKNSPVWSGDQTRTVQVDKVVTDATDTGKWNTLRNIVYYSPSYPGFKKNIEGIKQFYYGDEAKDYGVAIWLLHMYMPEDLTIWRPGAALTLQHAEMCGQERRLSRMHSTIQTQTSMKQFLKASRFLSAIWTECRTW